MTRVVAQVVYQLDMDELPLKKLEKQQNKSQARGRSRSSAADMSNNRRKTFSQGLLMKSFNVNKSHPFLNRTGSGKREQFLSGGSASTSHRSLNPTAKATNELQLGDISNEPLLVDSMVSLVSDSTRSLVERQPSTSSQQQQLVHENERRSSEPTSNVDHTLLSQAFSAPTASSNTPSPLLSHSPLVQSEHKSLWPNNDSPVGHTSVAMERQTSSAFDPPLLTNDNNFILTNEHVDTSSQSHVCENSLSGSRRTSNNSCTTPEPKRHMVKAYSVDESRQKILSVENSSNRLLSSPDSFSSDILPDRGGSIKVRRAYGSSYKQPSVIHEEKMIVGQGSSTGDCFIRT